MTNTTHKPTRCKRAGGVKLRYSARNWSDEFVCSACGRTRRFSINRLGRRVPQCDGVRITAGDLLTTSEYQNAIAAAGGAR